MNGKPSYLYLCTSLHTKTAHRTIARCNDGDDVVYSVSYF